MLLSMDIQSKLTEFIEKDSGNRLKAHNNMKMYEEPLVGIASGEDELFTEFKKEGIIGRDFLLPKEWLEGAKSVVVYFLPFTKQIRESNRGAGLPSEEWVSARIDGEIYNRTVRLYLMELFDDYGGVSLAPALDSRYKIVNRISNWSERHAAYAAGLGTFGLHRGLITKKGTTGRFGSVITTLEIEPSKRPYTRYDEYCPFLTQGKCGACIKKCPPAAISREGKDNGICANYIDNEVQPLFKPRYGCAKCNISVPCEYSIPLMQQQ